MKIHPVRNADGTNPVMLEGWLGGGQELAGSIDLTLGLVKLGIEQKGRAVLANSLFFHCPVGLRSVIEGHDLEIVPIFALTGAACRQDQLVLVGGVVLKPFIALGVVYDVATPVGCQPCLIEVPNIAMPTIGLAQPSRPCLHPPAGVGRPLYS